MSKGGAELEASQPQKEGTNPQKRNGMSSQLLPQESRHPRPLEIGAQQKKSIQKRRRRPQTHPELENEIKKNFLKRNASRKLPFHRDRRGMNFVNRFLASY